MPQFVLLILLQLAALGRGQVEKLAIVDNAIDGRSGSCATGLTGNCNLRAAVALQSPAFVLRIRLQVPLVVLLETQTLTINCSVIIESDDTTGPTTVVPGPYAISVVAGGNLTMQGINLFGNDTAPLWYLSSLNIGVGGTAVLRSCAFLKLTARAIGWDWHVTTAGGAISNQGNLTVVGCTFRQNSVFASTQYNSGTTGASAACGGGAIRSTGTLIVTNSTFVGNSVDVAANARVRARASGDGGAIWATDLQLGPDCFFIDNRLSVRSDNLVSCRGGAVSAEHLSVFAIHNAMGVTFGANFANASNGDDVESSGSALYAGSGAQLLGLHVGTNQSVYLAGSPKAMVGCRWEQLVLTDAEIPRCSNTTEYQCTGPAMCIDDSEYGGYSCSSPNGLAQVNITSCSGSSPMASRGG